MEISDALVSAITREILRRLQSGEITLEDPPCPEPEKRKKVISEMDIMRLCPASGGMGQNADMGISDIITPLAADYIAKMRITVNRIG